MAGALSLNDVEKAEWASLIRALLKEQGFSAVQKARGTFLQFGVRLRGPFEAEISAIVRVYFEPLTQSAIDDALASAESDGAGCLVLIETSQSGSRGHSIKSAAYVGPTNLKDALESSSFIRKMGNKPVLSFPEIAATTKWGSGFDMAALPCLRWLPALARNKRPVELRDTGISADRLFERAFFRVMTDVYQLRGSSWGERTLFTAKPDGWIAWKNGGAIYDCKAASAGYRMNSTDWRKFRDYSAEDVTNLRTAGELISHLVVISSSFPGGGGKRHAVYSRAKSLAEKCDLNLSYVRALDLAAIGKEIEARGLSPDQRRAIDWGPALTQLPTFDSLMSLIPEHPA